MNITAVKSDSINIFVTAKIEKSDIEKEINKIAKRVAKREKIDGFRKGKAPISIIKRIYKDSLRQEADNELIGKMIDTAIKSVDNVDAKDVIGDPYFKKYNREEWGLDMELIISLKPKINIEGYKELVPKYEKPVIEDSEIEERLNNLLEINSIYKKVDEDRALKEGDQAIFDFVGKIDGKEFEGGKAKNYALVIGSKQFIPGFEEQMVGMKKGETKDIKVKFPEDYQSKELAGKDATFTVTLHSFKSKEKPKLDEETIKKLLPGVEDANEEMVRDFIKKQLQDDKLTNLYHDRLKPEFIETLVKNYQFELPKSIVEQEIDAQLNQKLRNMTPEEIKEYREPNKLKELRESLREDAINSVKATFLIDALAKEENITIDDNEVAQTIYYEALVNNQEPEQVIKYYQENNLFPAIKMGIIEDKLFLKILELDK